MHKAETKNSFGSNNHFAFLLRALIISITPITQVIKILKSHEDLMKTQAIKVLPNLNLVGSLTLTEFSFITVNL